MRSLIFLAQLTAICRCEFNSKAWQSIGTTYTFPEQEYEDINSKPNVAITFSGGGDRAFTSTIGFLAAFHELGFTERVKYIGGSSGGSWATAVYSYYQRDDIDDTTMLGPVIFPEDIVYEELPIIDENCVRRYVNATYILGGIFFSDWMDAVQVQCKLP